MFDQILQMILSNKEWIFSGVGVVIAGLILGVFIKKKAGSYQAIKSGNNSKNIQAGRDIHIGDDRK
jgi:hypothetical protein